MAVKDKKVGKQTIKLENPPKIISTYSIVGPKEGDGPLKDYFHEIISDDTLGKDSFEKAESEMMYTAIKGAISAANLTEEKIDYLFTTSNDNTVKIINLGEFNAEPTAIITLDKEKFEVGETVNFSAAESYDDHTDK